ncbi:MAG TPA: molybdopterin-dependent oxidoreductase [Solirubrobacteraceae bacterium]
MTARGTDWGLAALVALLIATGVLTLFAGTSGAGWVYALHDGLGFAIAVLLVFKLRRVWPRLAQPALRDRKLAVSVAALVFVLAAVGSGWLWDDGATVSPAGYSLLSWHDLLGAMLAIAVVGHMVLRAKRLRSRDVTHRRQFLAGASIAVGSLLVWRAERPVQALLGLRGAHRRFTGSYEAASFAGNAFPTTSWVADDPAPIDPGSYRLAVGGLVTTRLLLSLPDLSAVDEVTATLDCTGGFYSTQRWRGVRLSRLLEQAGAAPRARHLRVVSRTGYRWSFALAEAPGLLLATHIGDEPLSHDHGAPVRLVAPSSRGFQWVKWVERVDLLEQPDYGAPASTLWSSLTAAGRGRE